MGLFQKNAASKLFSSSFAIESDETIIGEGKKEEEVQNHSVEEILADESLLEDIEDGKFEAIESVDSGTITDSDDRSLSISQVVQLVRSLPQQGTEEELHAVLRTLEIFNIDVRYVLEDSYRKESVTTQRIDTLLSEISTLDEEIDKRAKEIKMLEVGITEMVRVNECLELMLKLDDELVETDQDTAIADPVAYPVADTADITEDDSNNNSSATPDYTIDPTDQNLSSSDDESTILKAKSTADKLDDYVKNGKTETLDGIVIDLDSPPKKQKLKLSRKAKTKRKKKATAEQEE